MSYTATIAASMTSAITGITLAIVFGMRSAEKRRAALIAWAQANELTYQQSVPALATNWSGHPFDGGRGGRALDVITGMTATGRPFCSFKYEYVVSTGKSTSTVTQAVTALRLPALMPELAVTPEGFGAKVAKVFGGQDVQVGDYAFDKAFRVRADDERYAHDVLNPLVTQWMTGPGRWVAQWRISGADLICWHPGRPIYANLFPELERMTQLVDLIPNEVWSSYGRELPPGTDLR